MSLLCEQGDVRCRHTDNKVIRIEIITVAWLAHCWHMLVQSVPLKRSLKSIYSRFYSIVIKGEVREESRKKALQCMATLDEFNQIESDRYKEAQVGTLPVLHSL